MMLQSIIACNWLGAYTKWLLPLVQIMACHLFSNNLLSKTMMANGHCNPKEHISMIFIWNSKVLIQITHLKMLSAKWLQFWRSLNVLIYDYINYHILKTTFESAFQLHENCFLYNQKPCHEIIFFQRNISFLPALICIDVCSWCDECNIMSLWTVKMMSHEL